MYLLFLLKFSTHKEWFLVIFNSSAKNVSIRMLLLTERLLDRVALHQELRGSEAGLYQSGTTSRNPLTLRGPRPLSPPVWTPQDFPS